MYLLSCGSSFAISPSLLPLFPLPGTNESLHPQKTSPGCSLPPGKLEGFPEFRPKLALGKPRQPRKVALTRCFWSKKYLSGSLGIVYLLHKIPSSIYCPQIVKTTNEMSCTAFDFAQRRRCLYFLSHHKYVIPLAIQYCSIITTLLQSWPYFKKPKSHCRSQETLLPSPETYLSLDLYPWESWTSEIESRGHSQVQGKKTFGLCCLNLSLNPSACSTAPCVGSHGRSRSTPALKGSTIHNGCGGGGNGWRGGILKGDLTGEGWWKIGNLLWELGP